MTSTDPAVQQAERLWKLAEAEPDRETRTQLWEDTSEAFAKVVAANAVTRPELDAAASAAWLALRNAFHIDARTMTAPIDLTNVDAPPVPQQLPTRLQRMLRVIETVRKLDATSDDSVAAHFFAGMTLYRFDHLDEALAIFTDIIDKHPRHDAADSAVRLALQTYSRQGKRDAMLALVERLRADTQFLAGRSDLATRLDHISFEARRTAIELAEKKANATHNRSYGHACGEQYLALVSVAGSAADEILTRASSCFATAGSIARALDVLRTLLASYPTSKLVAQTHATIAVLEARLGNFSTAAAAWERAWQAYEVWAPGRYESMISATNALYDRIQLGEWARVDTLLARIVRAFPAWHKDVEVYIKDAVQGALVAGKRAEAVRWLMRLPSTPVEIGAEDMTTLLLDASCPVAPVDGLCPRKRNAALLAWARRYLIYLRDSDHAALLRLSLDLEEILANHASASRLASVATKLAPFTEPRRTPKLRVLAHARLARIARETKDPVAQRTHLEACLGEASAAMVEQPTLVSCERDLVALKVPTPALRELLPNAVPTLIVSEPPL